jgi:hypothetical protein
MAEASAAGVAEEANAEGRVGERAAGPAHAAEVRLRLPQRAQQRRPRRKGARRLQALQDAQEVAQQAQMAHQQEQRLRQPQRARQRRPMRKGVQASAQQAPLTA